jgi:hypothetical protein
VFGTDARDAVEPAAAEGAVAAPEEPAEPEPDAPEPDAEPDLPTEPVAAGEPARNGATRQTLAESVLSVLREEAARETAVRREEEPTARIGAPSGSMETQTEFGLDASAAPSGTAATSAAARHIARLKGTDSDLPPAPPSDPLPEPEPKAAARRDLLPDIEEINSTLRADSDRAQEAMDSVDALPDLRPRRRGFRSGFILMMILAVALAMAYVMAPRIIAQIPGSAPTMRAYVAAVDRGRLWLDGMMQSASGSVRNFSGDGN